MLEEILVIAFGVLVICMGAWIMVRPFGLKQFADLFLTSTGLWAAVALRLTFGVLLWMSASASRMPRTLRVLGALFVIGGLALPVVGRCHCSRPTRCDGMRHGSGIARRSGPVWAR